MNKTQFSKHMGRLVNRYKSKFQDPYPAEVQKVFWNQVCKISEAQWESTVNVLMASSLRPPMLPEIREIVNPLIERITQKQKEKERNEAMRALNNLKKGKNLTGKEIGGFIKKLERGLELGE